jgi:hypothetical protein
MSLSRWCKTRSSFDPGWELSWTKLASDRQRFNHLLDTGSNSQLGQGIYRYITWHHSEQPTIFQDHICPSICEGLIIRILICAECRFGTVSTKRKITDFFSSLYQLHRLRTSLLGRVLGSALGTGRRRTSTSTKQLFASEWNHYFPSMSASLKNR